MKLFRNVRCVRNCIVISYPPYTHDTYCRARIRGGRRLEVTRSAFLCLVGRTSHKRAAVKHIILFWPAINTILSFV